MRASTILSFWLPPILWSGLIFYLSSIPGLNSGWGVWDLIFRKMAHMVEYGILAVLLIRAIRRSSTSLTANGVALIAGSLSVFYAVSDEIHQGFVPGRGPSAADVAFDAAGVMIALWLVRRWTRRNSGAVYATAKKLLIVLATAVTLAACGADASFKRARGAESKGRAYEAWQKYQAFAARHPRHEKAVEAVFRAGWLAQTKLGDCDASRAFYARVTRDYPSSDPWAARARFQSQNCPDYFPLTSKTAWVEGDSDSGGQNARIESVVHESSTPSRIPFSSANVTRTYFAGPTKFRSVEIFYRKDGGTVWEHPSGGEAPRIILKSPIAEGTRWTSTAAGRKFSYEIVSTTRTINVAAGSFEGCLHVRAKSEGVPGATNEYYAPSVGRVLTSYTTEKGERRNTELLSYTPGEKVRVYP